MNKSYIERKVKDHFTNPGTYRYNERKGFVHREDPIILDFISSSNNSQTSKVLEVGGGSGYMLDLISSEISINDLYNCEIVPEVYRMQANKNINLIGCSVLDIPFRHDSFKYVIIKNLLHHLIGNTRKKSKDKAICAVKELIRVAEDGGYIIILEQYNRHRLFASIIFYITCLFSLFRVSFKSFGWNQNIIVSFLTSNEIRELVMMNGREDVEIFLDISNKIDVPIKYKASLLMSDIGRILLIGKICKHTENSIINEL